MPATFLAEAAINGGAVAVLKCSKMIEAWDTATWPEMSWALKFWLPKPYQAPAGERLYSLLDSECVLHVRAAALLTSFRRRKTPVVNSNVK